MNEAPWEHRTPVQRVSGGQRSSVGRRSCEFRGVDVRQFRDPAFTEGAVCFIYTDLTCKDGQYALAGTVSPKDAKGEIDMTRKVMIFVKCDILIVR